MRVDVVMPQMGESIAEGTIVRWIKKVGDAVDRDEPLFEISTDKVDAEIPAPAAGVLTEIKVKEGETVAVNSVVGTIGTSSEIASSSLRSPSACSGFRVWPGFHPAGMPASPSFSSAVASLTAGSPNPVSASSTPSSCPCTSAWR